MMADLISRAAAIEYLMTNMGWHNDDGYTVDDADEKRAIITDLVNGIPAVDAVPVVRCKDCLFFCDMSDISKSHQCSYHSVMGPDGEIDNIFYTAPEAYCAWGERRDNDATD